MKDARGLAVSNASGEVIEAVDRFTRDLIGGRTGAVAMLALADAHPECALLQVYAAALHAYSQAQADIDSEARRYLARARTAAQQPTDRERALLDAVGAWVDGDFAAAIAIHERMAEQWPQDVAAAKFAEFLFFLAPDYPRHLRFMERIAAANADLSDFKAMHAFALEMAGEYARAEAVANEAIERQPHTPWAHHALAHVHLNQGRIDEGIAAQRRFQPSWDAHMQTIRGHNGWHLALLHLARLEFAPAFALYRTHVAGLQPDAVVEHVDVISLLWRAELAGASPVERWAPLGDHLVPRANEQVFPFLNAHYVYGLARGGREREADTALALMRSFAERQSAAKAHVWLRVGLPLAEGCLAFARGDYGRAATCLAPLQAPLFCIGGSDAQVDLFRQTYLLALIESKQYSAARALLDERTRGRLETPLEALWRSRV